MRISTRKTLFSFGVLVVLSVVLLGLLYLNALSDINNFYFPEKNKDISFFSDAICSEPIYIVSEEKRILKGFPSRFDLDALMGDCYKESENSVKNPREIFENYRLLEGSTKACVDKNIDAYQKLFIERCIEVNYGKGIGGGCYHLARGISSGLVEYASEKCLELTMNK